MEMARETKTATLAAVAVSAAAVLGVAAMLARRKRGREEVKRFVKFKDVAGDAENPSRNVLAVDCEARKVENCLTHHRCAFKLKPAAIRGDSSTDLVLEALRQNHEILDRADFVTCNHFDIDAFTCVLALVSPRERVLANEAVFRETARIGDFRELDIERLKAGDENVRRGLELCCFLNTLERREFARPFEDGSDPLKWDMFLEDPRVWDIIEGRGHLHRDADWGQEFDRVLSDCASIRRVQHFPDLGLVVIEAPEPVHYYALFSGNPEDVVLALYDGNRYELEQRYSTYVELCSRPVLPRVCLTHLAKMLSKLTGESWHANRFTDSGPLMRIDKPEKNLNKAERYGHPYERPIYASKLDADQMLRAVQAYLTFGLDNAGITGPVPAQDLSWSKLHELNGSIDWSNLALEPIAA
ncbi:Hypothetical Protein FCC1311_107692 [Hondaea fermentalgiana]|uniref:Uncharacterized protein n=1 Tax=Hondaea fermentalgiana TaxID=2315210 RepID=A0A2R5GVF3_9STRA|nr:Hypothetical Protein FCC1311_107692 [Hondaea fermentalgiana]|eukprot:GBG34545.1 Hypothetical Protein FCC1311_107692 [Hondaea fermentalgiana]